MLETKVLYVDPSGTDKFAVKGDPNSPWGTLTEAKHAAASGDTIIVRPGTYAENNLLKNGVNWRFLPGAIVSYQDYNANVVATTLTRPNDDASGYGIFDDRATGAVTCTIDGAGVFIHKAANTKNGGLFTVTNSGSVISFKARSIEHNRYSQGWTGAPSNQGGGVICVTNCSKVFVQVDDILEGQAGTIAWFFISDPGPPEVDSVRQQGTGGAGVYWEQGEFHLTCNKITTSGSSANYGVWAHDPGNATGNLWVTANLLENSNLYADSGSGNVPNWRGWFDIKEIRASATQSAAVEMLGGGKFYLRAEKLSSPSTQSTVGYGLQVIDGVTLWANIQKITCAGAPWLSVKQGSNVAQPTLFADILHFEDAGTMAGLGMETGGTAGCILYLRGLTAKINNGKILTHSGGPGICSILGLRMDSKNTNSATNHTAVVAGANLVLQNCVLLAPALADSVNAGSAQTITNYTSKTNKAKNVNVTVNVDALTVDANVV